MDALARFGAPVQAHGVSQEDFTVPDNVYQIGLPPRRIDLLTGITGVGFEKAWRTRMETELGGVAVSMLGRECLIENKRATGRDKDLVDVRELTSKR